MVTLEEYQFWHWNRYREQRCVAWEPLIQDCAAWQDTGATRERPQDSCAARPEWVVADVVNGAQATPAAPSGATCNRHDSYLEGNVQWVFTTARHRTVATGGHAGEFGAAVLPAGFRDPGPTRSTNTNPPNGRRPCTRAVTRSRASTTGRSAGAGGGRLASCTNRIPGTTSTTAGREVTTTTEAGRGIGGGTCSYDIPGGSVVFAGVADELGREGDRLFVFGCAAGWDVGVGVVVVDVERSANSER